MNICDAELSIVDSDPKLVVAGLVIRHSGMIILHFLDREILVCSPGYPSCLRV